MGASLLAFSWREALRPELPAWEGATFDAVNQLPEVLRASWPVMQLGSFAAIPVVSIATYRRSEDHVLSATVGGAGLTAYVGAKIVKRRVGRPRPLAFRPDLHARENA